LLAGLLLWPRGTRGQLRQTTTVQELRHWNARPEREQMMIAVVTAAEWIHLLAALTTTLEAPVARAVAVAGIPWWRARPEMPT
jgi:hypothetical protein